MQKRIFFITLLQLISYMPHAAVIDSLQLSFPQAEKIFLRQNLSLLAAGCRIDAAKAMEKQAGLWDNPVLYTDQNIYDGKLFRHDADHGQLYIQVQQLFKTAGKRNKLLRLSEDNTSLVRLQFDELMRTLRYALLSDFIETAALLEQSNIYRDELVQVQVLVNGMDEVYKAGNISLKENLRLKALLFNLQHDADALTAAIMPLQQEIRVLLNLNDGKFVIPVFDHSFSHFSIPALPPADTLISRASIYRPDVKMAATALQLARHNLAYQQALSKPDITAGPEYDRRNSYQPDYIGLSIAVPLNLFNRNQGNIRSAHFETKEQELENSLTGNTVANEVRTAYEKTDYYNKLINQDNLRLEAGYDQLMINMMKSYRDRQVSLLDFTDFLDTYTGTRNRMLETEVNLFRSVAELNYAVNQDVILLN